MMGFGGLGMILFWVVVIVGIIWLVIALGGSNLQLPKQSGNGQSAREILDQRYARGEIDREEYEAMKQDLK
ncbi:MAG: SHOCT domain-containing protein [Anaerolineales bacterium]|uniref:SHOCT domain-containing protein n=1 Tax=Candidatus Desulfolinea nitratireducens TaxID=2841698 RepID=A0A8J6TJU4_9CHLR|nr:SHOCT domain-containing protein [Candidatus Desulfolinea nitratireducens]MBL6960537.1 SHOCT domain-containing protein [Anaerolineales bacterium]